MMARKNPVKTPNYVLEYQGFRIVVIPTSKGPQPFCRASQKNNARPTEWLPFDRVCLNDRLRLNQSGQHCMAWFDKARFSGRAVENTPLERYGTEENKQIAIELKKMDDRRLLPEPKAVNKEAVNIFIGTPTALKANLQFKSLNIEDEPTLGIKPCPDIYKAKQMYPAGLAVTISKPSNSPPAPSKDVPVGTLPPSSLGLTSLMTTVRHFG